MYLIRTFLLLILSSFAGPVWAERALFAVATNFAETADILAEGFSKDTGHTVEFAFGATGKIYAQILRGAPFDGFLAADQERPSLLHAGGQGGPPFTYAEGVLVWWPVLRGTENKGKIAIANPDLAPYGIAARQVLEDMQLWEDLQDRLVMGENIGQTFAMVATGNASAGLVALSSVKSARNTKDWDWSIATGHGPILQDAILLNRGRTNAAAIGFLAYLKTDVAREIIASSGYKVTGHD